MKPKSRAGGFFYMGNTAQNDKKLTKGAMLIVSKVLKHVMSLAAEAEIGAVFINARERSCPQNNIGVIGTKTSPHTNGNG
jgi:hypothetical protein